MATNIAQGSSQTVKAVVKLTSRLTCICTKFVTKYMYYMSSFYTT